MKRSLHLLVPGSTAVVVGAGGVGDLAIQILATLSPAVIVAVDQQASALELAREVGAAHGVKTGATAAAEIRELTKGRSAELVLALVGVDSTLALAAAVVRTLGHLTLVGIGGGSVGFGFFTQAFEASLATTYWGSLPDLAEVITLAEAGRLRARVQQFPLEGALGAYEALKNDEVLGRAVIVPAKA